MDDLRTALLPAAAGTCVMAYSCIMGMKAVSKFRPSDYCSLQIRTMIPQGSSLFAVLFATHDRLRCQG